MDCFVVCRSHLDAPPRCVTNAGLLSVQRLPRRCRWSCHSKGTCCLLSCSTLHICVRHACIADRLCSGTRLTVHLFACFVRMAVRWLWPRCPSVPWTCLRPSPCSQCCIWLCLIEWAPLTAAHTVSWTLRDTHRQMPSPQPRVPLHASSSLAAPTRSTSRCVCDCIQRRTHSIVCMLRCTAMNSCASSYDCSCLLGGWMDGWIDGFID